MQLLDENHLLLKYASEDVVVLKTTETNSQPSFFVVYNIISTEVRIDSDNRPINLIDELIFGENFHLGDRCIRKYFRRLALFAGKFHRSFSKR